VFISKKGLDIIKYYEGLSLKAYLCPARVWTIGYGHTLGVQKGDTLQSEYEAEKLLKNDSLIYDVAVQRHVKVELNQNQYDALVSLTYNIGEGALQRSTLLRKLNKKNYRGAQREFKKWVYEGKRKLRGLIKRRHTEAKLFGEEYVALPIDKTKKPK